MGTIDTRKRRVLHELLFRARTLRTEGRLGMGQRLTQEEKPDVSQLVAKAQEGDALTRENLLRSYRPFYLRVASSMTKKYLVLGRDDEASIAMLAFDEAIISYNSTAGASFLSFAEMVIKRRMVDYFRKKGRSKEEIPMSSLDADEAEESVFKRIESKEAFQVLQIQKESEERREELFRLNQLLSGYGISFSELPKISPKHQDARERALEVARIIASNPPFLAFLTSKRTLPLKELQRVVSVSRKTLERQRKYIITLTLILVGEFIYLQEYLRESV